MLYNKSKVLLIIFGGTMKSIFVPNESFENKSEIDSINSYLYKNSQLLLEEIDDLTEIWIIGSKDEDFFKMQTIKAFEENRVLDPFDIMPVAPYKKIQHIAVINHKYGADSSLNTEIIYANADNDVTGFTQMVIHLLMKIYPKKRSGSDDSELNKSDRGDLALTG